MTKDDPTDHALAAIASILDNREALTAIHSVAKDDVPRDTEEKTAPAAEVVTVVAESVTVTVVSEVEAEDEVAELESPTTVPEPIDINGYSRSGPGPLDAIRFRWTARRDDDGQYFVDETIGSSRPISSGPMSRDEVVRFIDSREFAARQRFDELKTSMSIGSRDQVDHDR